MTGWKLPVASSSNLAAAAGNRDVVQALSDEITAARTRDHSRALLGLSVLGEMRSPHALVYLKNFIHIPPGDAVRESTGPESKDMRR